MPKTSTPKAIASAKRVNGPETVRARVSSMYHWRERNAGSSEGRNALVRHGVRPATRPTTANAVVTAERMSEGDGEMLIDGAIEAGNTGARKRSRKLRPANGRLTRPPAKAAIPRVISGMRMTQP